MHLEFPMHDAFMNADVRVDGGVRAGDAISPYYDPMIAKLIVRGADREQARARMLRALAATQIVGVHTNVAFLSRLMGDEAFAQADLDTGLIERRRAVKCVVHRSHIGRDPIADRSRKLRCIAKRVI
jgi:3-methylcrotonyl-CoA carboxylase alpha subunit